MENKIECICSVCSKKFERSKSEVKRNKKLNRKVYCSRICSGVGNKETSKKNLKDFLSNIDLLKPDNRKDLYTPYRYFLRCAKRRYKEVDISLEDLKQLWESQMGICPLTGKNLSIEHNYSPYQASLDRIDNSKGYIKGNLRYIALIANYCRNNFADQEVFDFCKSVVDFQKGGNK